MPSTVVIDFVALLTRMSARYRQAYLHYIQDLEAGLNTAEMAEYVKNNDQQSLLAMIVQYIVDFPDVIADMFNLGGRAAIRSLEEQLQGLASGLRVEFDPGNPEAAKALESEQLRFIREISDGERDLIRDVLRNQIEEGTNPLEAAREIKQFIGLTSTQWDWVNNYQDALECGSASALDRALRDRRFDSTITSVIENDDVLSSNQIERMVGAYTKRMIQYRAQTIARTEAMRTMSISRHEAWRQQVEAADFDPDHVQKEWIATDDDRTRDTHAEMNGQVVMGLDTPFESPSGELLLYPCDPLASPEETIQCRCTVTMLMRQSRRSKAA